MNRHFKKAAPQPDAPSLTFVDDSVGWDRYTETQQESFYWIDKVQGRNLSQKEMAQKRSGPSF